MQLKVMTMIEYSVVADVVMYLNRALSLIKAQGINAG